MLRRAVGCLDKLISTTPGRPATLEIYLSAQSDRRICAEGRRNSKPDPFMSPTLNAETYIGFSRLDDLGKIQRVDPAFAACLDALGGSGKNIAMSILR